MKRLMTLSLIFLCFASNILAVNAQPVGLLIKLHNLPDGINFYISHRVAGKNKMDTLEVARSANGVVRFKSKIGANGELFFVGVLNRNKAGLRGPTSNWIRVFFDDGDVLIEGDMNKWPVVKISGSKSTAAYEKYYEVTDPMLMEMNEEATKLFRKEISDSSRLKTMMNEFRVFSLDYLRKHINMYSISMILSKNDLISIDEKKGLLAEMNGEARNSFYAMELKENIDKLEFISKAKVELDLPLTDFEMEGEDGKLVSIQELVSKSEYTLIDFWAYWCAPCRAIVPELKEAYDKYRSRGFNIISISTDPDKGKWKAALKQLDTKWVNLIDHEQITKRLFFINAIPGYILLNRKAEIIAMQIIGNRNNGASQRYFKGVKNVSLHGKEIEMTLNTLMD